MEFPLLASVGPGGWRDAGRGERRAGQVVEAERRWRCAPRRRPVLLPLVWFVSVRYRAGGCHVATELNDRDLNLGFANKEI